MSAASCGSLPVQRSPACAAQF